MRDLSELMAAHLHIYETCDAPQASYEFGEAMRVGFWATLSVDERTLWHASNTDSLYESVREIRRRKVETLIEIRAAEGGDDAKDLVGIQLAAYQKRLERL